MSYSLVVMFSWCLAEVHINKPVQLLPKTLKSVSDFTVTSLRHQHLNIITQAASCQTTEVWRTKLQEYFWKALSELNYKQPLTSISYSGQNSVRCVSVSERRRRRSICKHD